MGDYASDRRLFAVMRLSGWDEDPETNGFTKWVDRKRLWVSWAQAEDALRLADEGEKVQGVAPLSESVARVVSKAANVLDNGVRQC